MDFVVVAGSWPPRQSPRSIQNVRLLNALGRPCRVFCPDVNGKFCPDIGRHVYVEHLPARSFSRLSRALRKVGIAIDDLPDPFIAWALGAIGPTLREASRTRRLLSIGTPHSSHIVAACVKAMRPQISWIAYFSDPWTQWGDTPYRSTRNVARFVNGALEAAVFRLADAFLFPHESLERLFCRNPLMASKPTGVVSQMFETTPSKQRRFRPSVPPQPCIIRYVGGFYGPRSPKHLLEALVEWRSRATHELEWMRLEFVGPWGREAHRDECLDLMRQLPMVEWTGERPYPDAMALTVQSDVLLHLNIPTNEACLRPSKLVEYLGAGRPIAAICCPGPESDLVAECGGWYADVRDRGAIIDVFRRLRAAYTQGRLEEMRSKESIRQRFSSDRVASEFASFVRRTPGLKDWHSLFVEPDATALMTCEDLKHENRHCS